MDANSNRRSAEPMRLNELEAYLYEAIATLEYIGHPVTRTELAGVADLDDATMEATLRDMTSQGYFSCAGSARRRVPGGSSRGLAGLGRA
jgi:hypothetical protein